MLSPAKCTHKRSGDRFVMDTNNRRMKINPVDATSPPAYSVSSADDDDSNNISIRWQEEACVDGSNERRQTGLMKDEIMSAYPHEELLPITESRNGNFYFCIFHLLNSGIGTQILLLPVAFKHLGWYWGISTLSVAFAWQLYTSWLLVQLHESPTGTRYSRYLHLSIEAFGPKLGKILVLFPVMYLSGGTCVTAIINVGSTMELFHHTILCHRQENNNTNICSSIEFSALEWYIIFVCLAITVAVFLPNLNSMAFVSLIGAIAALCYCSTAWVFSVSKNRPSSFRQVSYSPPDHHGSEMDRHMSVFGAVGIIAFSFRGHNLLLEIQGTLQANSSQKTMWEAVKTVYVLIAALCLFPMAVGGYWAYGNQIPEGGVITAIINHSHHNRNMPLLGSIYILLFINSICLYQIYAMPVFDNFELRWVTIRGGKPCTRWARTVIRMFFGGLTFFIAVTFPFLPKISALVGGIALPITLAYPCFMWIAIKKERTKLWWLNLALGCCGVVLSVLVVVSSVWNLVKHHFHANFFHPK